MIKSNLFRVNIKVLPQHIIVASGLKQCTTLVCDENILYILRYILAYIHNVKMKHFGSTSRISGDGKYHIDQNIVRPVTVSKRPELIRSESENLEYLNIPRAHRTVSLGNLLNEAVEAGIVSSQQRSFTKLSDPSNSSDPTETVIFIKSCCLNHENTYGETNTQEKGKTETISDSRSKYINAPYSAKDYSSTKIHSSTEIRVDTENNVSHQKRQRARKKQNKSKQQKVRTYHLLNIMNIFLLSFHFWDSEKYI